MPMLDFPSLMQLFQALLTSHLHMIRRMQTKKSLRNFLHCNNVRKQEATND